MLRHIWRAWTHDYLCTLQQRSKWRQPEHQLKVNELVLLKNNNLPPFKWELARVLKVYPGEDGFIRRGCQDIQSLTQASNHTNVLPTGLRKLWLRTRVQDSRLGSDMAISFLWAMIGFTPVSA